MSRRKRPPSQHARFYRARELASFFDVNVRTIWTWVAIGQLPEPHRKPGWSGWPKPQIDQLLNRPGRPPAA